MRKLFVGFTAILAIALIVCFSGPIRNFIFPVPQESAIVPVTEEGPVMEVAPVVTEPTYTFGILSDSFQIINENIKPGESISEILTAYNINPEQLKELREKSKGVYNLRQIQANKPYTLLCANDSAQTAQYFIYQPSVKEYVVFSFKDSLHVYKIEKEVKTVERTVAGRINTSLYDAMVEQGLSPGLINHFADIFSWKINFGAIQPGDHFKLIFEENLVDGEAISYGNLKAAYFNHEGRELYAIKFDQNDRSGYYDENGKSLKKAFLKEPLEYTRISSRYTKRRFHPVQKRYKAHLGTDFAAPKGTPIRSVGEGVIIDAKYTSANGNYVKIKHDKTYTTQYLHMSRFAKGIRKGAKVTQGQTIGYVGSTGLASGPHLCYRFWKDGKQVDALSEKLPVARSIDKKNKDSFDQLTQDIIKKLNEVSPDKQPVLASEKDKNQVES